MQRPPVAATRPHTHTEHGIDRPDPYHWMRELTSPEVAAHLTAERDWYDAATAHLSSFIQSLETEMIARTEPTETSPRWEYRGSSYYNLYESGKDYPQFCREFVAEPGSANGNRRVLLDANVLVDASGYLDLGLTMVSPDERLLAYSVDRTGDEVFTLCFRDLTTGEDLPDEVARTYYCGAWSSDSSTFFYTVHDQAYRPHQVWRHRLGTPVSEDVLVLEEPDERFELELRSCRSGDVIVIWAASRDTTEAWAVDAHAPDDPPRSIGGRRAGVEYHAEHLRHGDQLLVVTNDDATEYRLATAPVPRAGDQDHTAWTPVRPEDPAERLERVEAFATHVVLRLRTHAQRRLRILPVDDLAGAGIDVRPAYPAGTVDLGRNEQYDASFVTVCDQAHVQPRTWTDVDLASGARSVRHSQSAPGHDPDRYLSELSTVRTPDGTDVPVTVVRYRDTPLDGTAPCLLYGYGAYEYVFEADWDPALPSLLDRGVVFAHAHVRGGGEGGRRWWLEGRLQHKQNTFGDFAAVADGLAGGRVDGARIVSRGLSAGGLLQGAVFSQRPDRWCGVVAEVPFVDVVSTMLDASIPLTVAEWDEWGDPRRREEFDWMLAYSPYDNLPSPGGRPDLLVTGALHDPRVMVWEPAKWVAALRDSDPAWSPRCVFRCELGAGSHVGPSGRFGHLAYEAEVYAWVLERMGVTA